MKGCAEHMGENRRIFDWIDSILRENGYKTVDVIEYIESYMREMQDGEMFKYALYQSEGEWIQYILVLDAGKTEIEKMDLENRQVDIYKRLQGLGEKVEPEFDKNVSLLLCVNGDIAEEKLEQELLKIEENPYCFKKLVLTYTEQEIECLKQELGKQDIWNYMQGCMAELQKDKEKLEDESIKFILKLFIKMPFLTVDVAKNQEKEELLDKIEKHLEGEYKHIWEDIKGMDLEKIGEIKNYSEGRLDAILDTWYRKEEKE